jgi:hypothetical protein
MGKILRKVPIESTIVDDVIQSGLCAGDIVKVSPFNFGGTLRADERVRR